MDEDSNAPFGFEWGFGIFAALAILFGGANILGINLWIPMGVVILAMVGWFGIRPWWGRQQVSPVDQAKGCLVKFLFAVAIFMIAAALLVIGGKIL